MSSIKSPANPPRTLPDVWLHDNVSSPSRVQWPSPLAHHVHQLGATERATIRITAPSLEDVPLGLGRISDGLFRIALLGYRGILPWASAGYVARVLQAGMYSTHPLALRHSKRGWEAIATRTEYGYLTADISATPKQTDPLHFRPMPLLERLHELAARA